MNLYETVIKFSARVHDAFTDLFPDVDHEAIHSLLIEGLNQHLYRGGKPGDNNRLSLQ